MVEPVVDAPPAVPTSRVDELSVLLISLLKGVLYQESNASLWSALVRLQARVRDFAAVLGLTLVLDEAEGYAFLRSRVEDNEEESPSAKMPRLVSRRPLSFPVSLLMALLRKKLAEFDARGGDTRLVLSHDEIVDTVRLFLPERSNDARLVNQVDTYINKVVELGFLRRLKTQSSRDDAFEVRRILKAFVDAQWLHDFDQRLAQYQARLVESNGEEDE